MVKILNNWRAFEVMLVECLKRLSWVRWNFSKSVLKIRPRTRKDHISLKRRHAFHKCLQPSTFVKESDENQSAIPKTSLDGYGDKFEINSKSFTFKNNF